MDSLAFDADQSVPKSTLEILDSCAFWWTASALLFHAQHVQGEIHAENAQGSC
jgi:hypothetical protein